MRAAVRISKFTYRSMSQSFSREIIMDKCKSQVVAVKFGAGEKLLGSDIPISRKGTGNRNYIPFFFEPSWNHE